MKGRRVQVVGRFAPSPSGRMHLGNLACCLLAWLGAKSKGGRIVLRIEDLDAERCPRHWADLLEQDLTWLGLTWDEGGSHGGPHGPYYQSERSDKYAAAFQKLQQICHIYPCFCSRSQLAASAPHGRDGQPIYPGTCRGLTPRQVAARSAQRPPAMRVQVPDSTYVIDDAVCGLCAEHLLDECGDFVLRRGDGVYAYQLAVVVDDADMGVNQVVRGADLLSSTARQMFLHDQLRLRYPSYCHIPLLLAADGRRLSKRDGDVSLEQLQARFTAPQIIGKLAYLYGLNPGAGPRTPQSLLEGFDWERVPRNDIRLPPDLFGV